MNINITGRHLEVTPQLKKHIEKKINHLERYFNHFQSAHVVVSIQRGRHFAEVTLKADRSELYSNAMTKDMYSSVDEMITKIEHQIKKYKEKLTSHPRKLFNELKHGERNL